MKFLNSTRAYLVCLAIGTLYPGSTGLAHANDPLQSNPASPWYLLDDAEGWHFDVGLGLEYEPGYAGSDEYSTEADIEARVIYRSKSGHRYFVSLGEVGGIFALSPATQFLVFLEYEEGREADDDDALEGLDEVDDTVEGQFMLARRFENVSIYAIAQPDLTGDADKGFVWFIGSSYDTFLHNNRWRIGTRFDISGADSEHMQTEFGITAAEAARTGYREYDPDGGLKSMTLGLNAEYAVTETLSLIGDIETEYYFDEGAASPLIEDLGSRTTVEASLLLLWRF